MLGHDKVADGRFGAGYPRSQFKRRVVKGVTDGTDSLETLQRLADDAWKECKWSARGSLGRVATKST